MLYESMRDKRTVITSGDYCCKTEGEERSKLKDKNSSERSKGKATGAQGMQSNTERLMDRVGQLPTMHTVYVPAP